MKTQSAKSHPFSLRLEPDLLKRTTQFARRRKVGVTTALRMLISERLDHLDETAGLDNALIWQREQAWAEFEAWERGKGKDEELTLDELLSAMDATIMNHKGTSHKRKRQKSK